MRKGVSLVGGGLVLLVVLALGGTFLSGINASSSSPAVNDYDRNLEEAFAPEAVMVNEIIDPWTPPDTDDQPAPGRRFVALSVTIENPEDSGGRTFISADFFKMIDESNFAYAPTASGLKPDIKDLDLSPGEKTSGWIVFEVVESSTIRSLTYWTQHVALPPH